MVPSYILLMLASKKTTSQNNHINLIACQFHAKKNGQDA